MASEEGFVIKVGIETAWVKTTRSSACKSCASQGSCNSQGKEVMEVEAVNIAHAKVGDRIVLTFASASLLKATFLLYVFPILCMLGGAIFGQVAGPMIGVSSNAASPILAFLCLGVAFLFVKVKGNRLGAQDAYRPKITRIIGQ